MKSLKISLIIFVSFMSSLVGNYLFGKISTTQAGANQYPERIVAHSIYLVDKNNKPKAGIGFDREGNPILFVKDNYGKTRAYLTCTPKGPLLGMDDKNGNTTLFMEASNDGSSSMGLLKHNDNKPRLMMAYSPDQGPSLGLFDENNIGKAIISVTDGNPSVTLLDHDNKPAIAMISKKGKGSLLGVWNSQNEPRISLGLLNDKPTFFMYEKYQTGLLFNMQPGGRPALALMDSGSPIWSATGAVPSAPELPPMDDMLHEITR